MEILRASSDDWERLRRLRLRALLDAPGAFGSTHDQEVGESEDEWRSWATCWRGATDQALFAAVDNNEWIGIAVGVRWQRDPQAVNLYAMWVEPSARRRGAGRGLVEAVTEWAQGVGVRRIVLRVAEGNPAALTLYEGCGYVATGEREALREGSPIHVFVMTHLL